MKVWLIALSFLLVEQPKLETLRTLYYQAANSGEASKQLNNLVNTIDKDDRAVLICYKGAAQMFRAKYALNPISKWSSFKSGKKYLELAAGKDPANIEIRFVRLAIQENLPSFLGYSQHISADKTFLMKHVGEITDAELKKNVTAYLKQIASPK